MMSFVGSSGQARDAAGQLDSGLAAPGGLRLAAVAETPGAPAKGARWAVDSCVSDRAPVVVRVEVVVVVNCT